jgi:PadR family transcriptional regulator, regulatory protein PadR
MPNSKKLNKVFLVIHKILMHICLMLSKDLLKGTLQTIILKMLADNEKMYGYEITQEVRRISNGKIELTEGALYPCLHYLEANGWLETEIVMYGKRARKYYSLTKKGKESCKVKLKEFGEYMEVMKLLLNPKLSWS